MFFYSADGGEPMHVHLERDSSTAKFWLNPVRIAWSDDFGRHEIQRIEKIVAENQGLLMEKWNECFKR
jgi:hypothetical protein